MNGTVGPDDVRTAAAACREALSVLVYLDWTWRAGWVGCGSAATRRRSSWDTRGAWTAEPLRVCGRPHPSGFRALGSISANNGDAISGP